MRYYRDIPEILERKLLCISEHATDLYCLISVVKDSCEEHEYSNQAESLELAIKIASKIIAKLSDLEFDWKDSDYLT